MFRPVPFAGRYAKKGPKPPPSVDPAGEELESGAGGDGERAGRSGHEHGFALADGQRAAPVVGEGAAAADADDREERIALREVDFVRLGEGVERRGEIGACHELYGAVRRSFVAGAVVGQHGVVDRFFCQGRVQFARVAGGIAAVEVVDAVGDVGGLLDFGDEGACTDRVDAACRQVENVARAYGVVGQQVGDRAVGDAPFVFVRGRLPRESRAQMGPFVGLYHVPHLGLAFRAVALPRQPVVGVHLDREVLPGVDELDEQRKLGAEAFVVASAEQPLPVAGEEFGQRHSRIGPLGHDRDTALHARELPAFADRPAAGRQPLVGRDLFAAPERGLEDGVELVHRRCVSEVMPRRRTP